MSKRDPEVFKGDQSLLSQPFIGHRELGGVGACQMPRSVGAAPSRDRLLSAHALCQEVPDASPAPTPLHPIAHPHPAAKPRIDLRNRPVVLTDPEVPHPPPQIVRQLCQTMGHRDAPGTAGKSLDCPLEIHNRILRPAETSADFCLLTPVVTDRSASRWAVGTGGLPFPFGKVRSPSPIDHSTHQGQISPDKNVYFPCTTASFTVHSKLGALSSGADSPKGSASYDVSVRRLAGLPPASFRPRLAATPLPWASSCGRTRRHRSSYRGLSPHQYTPMPGVHQSLKQTSEPGGSDAAYLRVGMRHRSLHNECTD